VLIVALAGLLAFLALRLALRRAPLPTLVVLGLIGLGLHTGALALPPAVTAPVTRADAQLKAWQRRQATRMSCEIVQTNELLGAGDHRSTGAGSACPSAP